MSSVNTQKNESENPETQPVITTPEETGSVALEVLASRNVSAVIVSSSLSDYDRLLVCSEARRQGIPCVVLDPYEHMSESGTEMRINPLDGPEVFLKAVATLLRPAQ